LGKYPTFTVGITASPEDVAKHVRLLRPKVIAGVASKVLALLDEIPDARELGVELVSTNSEASSPQQRRLGMKKAGVIVLDEYSSEELGIIAWENSIGEYVVDENTVHLELLECEETGFSEVIGTCLWSYTMPRIRYVQGDYAEWSDHSGKIDLDFPGNASYSPRKLRTIQGRQDMVLLSRYRGPVKPSEVLAIVDATLLPYAEEVLEFRIVQKDLQSVELLLKTKQGFDPSKVDVECTAAFCSLMKDEVNVEVLVVKEMPVLGTKHRCIIRDFQIPAKTEVSL
jgi:phenylacetate-CoA ligase